ncbi:MAG: IS4 family transposase [Chloroflexota bacterium]|nr:IS4 family transposase [Chloroflexota bacterium]
MTFWYTKKKHHSFQKGILMTSSILHELLTDKSYQDLPLPILQEIYPRELLCEALSQTHRWEERERKIPHVFLIYALIAWTIVPYQALKHVCGLLSSDLRWCAPQEPSARLTASALCYRRRTVGASSLRWLMRQACRPLCTAETPGAFLFGHRLVALDSKLFDVPDSAENDWTFRGRTREDQPRSHSPSPQVRLISALEIGSHAHLGAVLAPGYCSEMSRVEGVLSFLPPHSLILQDSGFRGAWWIQRLLQHGHESITRLQATDYPYKGEPRLPDGSYLVTIHESQGKRLAAPLTLRIIEYRLAPEVAEPLCQMQESRTKSGRRAGSAPDQVYRLAVTILDPERAPARVVAAAYHQRWELEIVYDEMQEHQMSLPRLQSKTSEGVLQEMWAILLGHYAVRAWMMRAAVRAGLDVDALSFTQAVSVLGTGLTLSHCLHETPRARWLPRLLQDLTQPDALLASRRVRSYPRVVKAARWRFYVKKEKDIPFVCSRPGATWDDFIQPLHGSPSPLPELVLLN